MLGEVASRVMRAIVQERYGSADVLHVGQVDKPAPQSGHVLVRVSAASLNALDKWTMLGKPFIARLMFGGVRRPGRAIRGVDVAGTVESVGPDVTRFRPGDEVFGLASGSFAEFASAEVGELEHKPTSISFGEAASLPIAGITALQGLRDTAGVRPGTRVLILGAGGGVGTFAVQIAKALGASVTAVTHANHVELVRSLGADAVLDYTQEDFATRPERYDVVFDISGTRSISACRRALEPSGVLVIVGGGNGKRKVAPLGRVVKAALLKRLTKPRIALCMAKPTAKDFAELKALVEAGKVRAVIDRRYPLEAVPEAMRYLVSGRVRGKLVVDVA